MKSLQRLHVALYAAILLIAANIIFLQLVTLPWARKVQDLGQLQREREERIAAEKKAFDDLSTRKKDLDDTLGDVSEFFDHMLVGEKDGYDRVRRALGKLADETGTSINSIGYSLEAKGPRQLQSMSLSFSVTGSYDQIRQFLRGIERSSVFLCVDSVDLTSGGNEADQVALSLRLSTLFKKAS